MLEEFKETLRRVLLAKYSIGFIDGYETGKADGYRPVGRISKNICKKSSKRAET